MKMRHHFYRAWFFCGIGALFYCYEYLLRITPSVMAPDLMSSFNVDAGMLGNLAAFYYYAYDPMQLPVGVLVDRFGPRNPLAIAALICAVGTFLFAHGSIWIAYLGRFLVGMGSAFAFVGVLKIATLWLPRAHFALAVGFALTLGMLGAMGGDILLGKLVATIGWRHVVNISAIVGLGISFLIWYFIPDAKKDVEVSKDSLVQDFQQLFGEFGQLIRDGKIWIIGLVGCASYLPLSFFAELWAEPFLIRAHGLTNTQATDITSMIFFGMAVSCPLIGWIADKTKQCSIPLLICIALTATQSAIILFIPKGLQPALYLSFFMLGVFSSGQTLIFALTRKIALPNLTGTALALTNMIVMIGGVLFQPLVGVLLDTIAHTKVTGDLTVYSSEDFRKAISVLPISLLIGLVIAFKLRKIESTAEENLV